MIDIIFSIIIILAMLTILFSFTLKGANMPYTLCRNCGAQHKAGEVCRKCGESPD